DDRALVEWLEQKSGEVHAAAARADQARADLGTARLPLPNPTLDAQLGGIPLGRANSTLSPGVARSLGFGNTVDFSVGLTQTIELGKRGPRVDAAELRVQGSKRAYHGTLGD